MKHYIRVDDQNRVIKGFSDAFEEPNENDILINSNGGRHFTLNGVVNPSLMNDVGIALYKYDNGIKDRSNEEIQTDIDAIPKKISDKERLEEVEQILADMVESQLLGGFENG